MAEKNLKVQEKKELKTGAESTRNVPVYIPPVDIYESEGALTILVDMPGVTEETVDIDLNNDQLTIRGTVPQEEGSGEAIILQEYRPGDYYRQFTIPQAIDRDRIEATIKNGVLKIRLPKAETAKPRKIEIKTV